MRSVLLLPVLFLLISHASAQLNCTTTEKADSVVTRCLHANRKVSTRIVWDKDNRWGQAEAFDSQDNRIINYQLRRVGGHASINFQYHPNGQIRRAEFSSAPDGGIQYYNMIHEFDEAGKQTRFTDLSRPDGFPRLTVPTHIYDPEKLTRPMVMPDPPPVPEVITCATPCQSKFVIVNRSRRKVTFDLHPQPSHWYSFPAKCCVTLRPGQQLEVYSITLAERYIGPDEAYRLEQKTPKRKRKTPLLIKALPEEENNQKTFVWYFL
jgi:hypothetical protein